MGRAILRPDGGGPAHPPGGGHRLLQSWLAPVASAPSGSALQSQLILSVEPGHGSSRSQFGAGVVGGHLGGSSASGNLDGRDSRARAHQVTGHPDPGRVSRETAHQPRSLCRCGDPVRSAEAVRPA